MRQRAVTPSGRARHAQRLPAAERRQALLDAAMRVFACGSYSGATTADIAREAGVSEPILYRHFASKRDLYLAVLDTAWERLRAAWEEAVADAAPEEMLPALGRVVRELKVRRNVTPPSLLWIQALTEAGEDPAIRRHLRAQLRAVHDFVAETMRTAQARGGMARDRDPDAEAWIFLGAGLLIGFGVRLGELLSAEDVERIGAARLRWLSAPESGP